MMERIRELFDTVSNDPNDAEARDALEAALADAGDPQGLVKFYELCIEGVSAPVEASAYMRRAAVLYRDHLGNAQRALELFSASLEGDESELVSTLGQMRALLRAAEDWENFVEVATAEMERTDGIEARAALMYEIGEVYEERFEDPVQAMEMYQLAFRTDPDCLKALWAARRVYSDAGEWEMVSQLLQIELEGAEDVDRQVSLFRELANVLVYELENAEGAVICLQNLLTLEPDDVEARNLLAELGGEMPGAEDDAEVEIADDEILEADDAGAEIADEDVIADVVDAEALDTVDPDAPEAAVDATEQELQVDDGDVEAMEAVEDTPAESETAEQTESAPEAELAADEEASGASDTAEETATDDSVEGIEAAEAETEPQTPEASDDAAEDDAPVATGINPERALELEASAAELDDFDKRDVLIEAAGLAGPDDVARIYLAAASADPVDVELYWRVGRTLTAPEETLQAIASGLDALAEADHYGAQATLTAHRHVFGAAHLGEARTADYKLRDLVKGGDDAVIDWQLQRLIETNKWRNAQQILADRAGGDPQSSRTAAMRVLAKMAEERMDNTAKAGEFWRQVFQADKSDVEARRALITLYEGLGKWKEYAEVLRLEVESISDDDLENKVAGLRKLVATISAHLRQDALVVQLYQKILELVPGDASATEVLAAKYESMRRWPDLVALLEAQAETADDDERLAIAFRIAKIYEEKFRNQAEAINAYEAVLATDPNHREAIAALDKMYEKRREWDKLVSLRVRLADLEEDQAERIEKYKALATYSEKKIRRPEITQALWEQVLETDPDDLDALQSLVVTYEKAKEWESLVEATGRLVDATEGASEKAALLLKAGTTLQDRIGDKARAAEIWQQLLAIDPANRRAFDSLKKVLIEIRDWEGLTELFGAAEKWGELARILDGQIGSQPDDDARIALLFRSAGIYRDQLSQTDRAVRAFERVLQMDGQNLEAAQALEPIYEENGDHRKHGTVLEVLLSHEDEPSERARIMRRSAELCEQHLRNPDGAFEWIRRLVSENPADGEARSELERLGAATHQWATVHDALDDALAQVDDEGAQLQILLSLGRILDGEMGAYEDALSRYQDALGIDPDNITALDAVDVLFTRMGQWHELMEVLERKLGNADEADQVGILRKMGTIYEEQLDDPEAAIERHAGILESDAEDRDALSALRRLYEATEQSEALHGILSRELALVDAAEEVDQAQRTALLLGLGRIELEHLDDVSGAVARFRTVLELDSTNAVARAALEGLLTEDEHQATVATILEPIYSEGASWESLVGCLEIQLEHTEDTDGQIELLERIGILHVDRIGDAHRAFDAFSRMLRTVPGNSVAITRLDQLAEAGDMYDQLAALLEEIAPGVEEPALARTLTERLAGVYEDRLADLDMAVDAHRRLLEHSPEHQPSLEALDRLYTGTQQWPELLEIYRRKLGLLDDPDASRALQFRMAEVLEDMLGDAPEAITVFGEILQADPDNIRALTALDRLYSAEEMWAELADILDRRLNLSTEESDVLDLRVRIAGLHERELGNVEQAVETYKAVLEADPDNELARGALEELISDPDFRAAIADVLEPIYQRRDDWARLVEVYEIQCEFSEENAHKITLLDRIARLHRDRGGDANAAFRCYARAFEVDPSHSETLSRLHELAEALDLWADLVDVYEQQVEDIEAPEIAKDIHTRLARILQHNLGDLERARDHYESALEHDPTDLSVVVALEEIYLATERWTDLVALLEQKLGLTEALDDKKALLFRICALHEEMLEDPEQAVTTLESVLELDESDRGALDGLERLFLGLERWEDLMGVLKAKAALTETLEERKGIYYVIGQTYERELDDLDQAVATYQQILDWDAEDVPSLQALDALHQGAENWTGLLDVLARLTTIAGDSAERITLQFRTAQVHDANLDDAATAIAGYQGILAEVPNHEPSLAALEALVRDDRESSAAAAALDPVFQEAGEWSRLIDVWRALIEVTEEPKARGKLYRRIGKAYEEVLLDADGAFAAFGEGFREQPGHSKGLASLERVARSAEAWPQLVTLIEDQVVEVEEDSEVRDLYLRVARILEEEMDAAGEAIERYRRALETDESHQPAILALDRLFEKEGRWAELAEIIQLRIEQSAEAEDADPIPLMLRLAALFEGPLEEVSQAISTYQDVLETSPKQADAVKRLEAMFEAGHEQIQISELLEPIYLEDENFTGLHSLLQALLAHQAPGEDRMRAMHRLASLSADQLGDAEHAFAWYGEALKEVPEDEHSRAELSRLAAELDGYESLMGIYTEAIGKTQDIDLIRSLSHEMAGIYRTKLGSDEGAEQLYQYILENLDPADAAALKGLDELFTAQARWPELVEILQREVEATYEEAEQIDCIYRLGQVYEREMADLDLAVDQYQNILERDPNHVAALARLAEVHQAREEWAPLYEVYERQAENAAENPEAKAEISASMARIAAQHLDQSEDAIELWTEVLNLRGEDREALLWLERLYQEQESWRELVDVCERQVNLLGEENERELELYAKLGMIWGDYLDRESNAIENWAKVLEIDPQNDQALWATRDLYDRMGDHAALATSIKRILETLAPEDDRRADLYRQLGRTYGEALEQPEDAISAWSQLLAIAPHDSESIENLEELYSQAENWSDCVTVLERKAEITEDPFERVATLFRVAEMHEEQLDNIAGGQGAYEAVLTIQPDNVDAFQQLERIYEGGEDWEGLVGLCITRLEHTEDTYEQLDLYEKTSKLFESKLDNTENAFVVLSQAFEASQDDERFGADLERLAAIGEYWSPLIETYQTVIEAVGQTPDSVSMRLRVARWWDEKLEQPQHAATHYQHVLSIDPDNLEALTSLENLLERYENWSEVVDILRRKVELVDEDADRKAIYQKMARLLEAKLDQADEAIEAYRQVMYLDERDMSTLDALERLYIVRMRWNDLIDVLNQQGAAMSDPAERIEKFLQIGELWETRLESPDRAIDAFREALTIDENCVEAMDCLERLYQQQERWIELLDTYELKLGILSEPAAQIDVYRRIASVQENNLNDVYSAVDTYRKLMSIDAGDRESMAALQRLYTDAERWDELAETYELHLGGVDDAQTILSIRTALGDVFSGKLNDAHRAIECLVPILESVADHPETLRTLGGLYRANEDWHNCIDMLSREAHQISDREELLQKQFEVGRIYLDNVGDLEQAERWFKGALDHDKNYMPALRALLDVNLKRGEWEEAVRALQMMEAASRQFADKSQCLFEIGQIYDQHIGDRTVAIDYYEQAMDMSPENASAAEPLLNVYWEEKNWARAAPLFDLILQDRTGMDIRDQQERLFRAGVCAENLEQVEKAITYYRQAYELDSTHLPTLKGIGGLLFRQEEWDRAFKIYQTVLVHHREHLEPQEIVDIFVRQGQIKLNVGERRKALDFFRKALDMDPQNTGTMEALITMHVERGDWEDVVHYQRQMVPLVPEGNDRFVLLMKIADTLNEKLNQPRQAVEAYNQALAEEPGSRMILGKLLGLHEDAGNWREAVAVLMQLAEGEQEATRKAKYWCGVATLQQKYLDERFEAVRSFDKALDADPTMLRAFEAIDHMLTEERNYERQDRYYRKMLKRATDFGLDDNLVFSLAKNLGEINRTRLKRYAEAIKAYKIALTRRPTDVGTHQIVAQLYELDGNTDQAIAQHYNLIKSEPRAIESYKHLYRLFMESARYDAAWCVAQVLVLFKQADDEQKAFFEKYRSRTLNRAQRPLEPRHWGALSHPDMSILLRNMLTEVWRYIVGAWASTHKDLRINKRKHLINPDEQTAFNGTLSYACQVTRFGKPACYRDPANRQGLRAANMQEPTLLVGDDVVRGARIQEQAFTAGKHLYLTQPAFFLTTLDEGYDQRKNRILATIYSIMKLVKPDSKVQAEQSLLDLFQKTIPQGDRVALGKQIGEMGSDPNLHLNVSKWLQAVDHTANRVGLLLSDDLVAATDVIKNETGTFSRASAQDRIRALVLFALSEEYFALRKALGLSIDSGQ